MVINTPPHLKYVATLPCNLSLIACFMTLMFHKVMWQHMQRVVGLLLTSLLQIYQEIFQWKNSVNRLRFDRMMVMSFCQHFLRHLYISQLMANYPHAASRGPSATAELVALSQLVHAARLTRVSPFSRFFLIHSLARQHYTQSSRTGRPLVITT